MISRSTDEAIGRQTMRLESSAFENGGKIPLQYTGEGRDLSPPLRWDAPAELPAGYALLVEDPDAPTDEPFVHWLVYNIPGSQRELPEGLPRQPQLAAQGGLYQGVNSFPQNNVGYRGPYPPMDHGRHHYHFHLYALRRPLHVSGKADKHQLLRALGQAGVIEETELVGTYERSSRRPKAG
jgi:Raf kinase inhibitor-like YbhB/YbcL family protein